MTDLVTYEWRALGYAAAVEPGEYSMRWRLVRLFDGPGGYLHYSHPEPTMEIELAREVASGDLRFDGCLNWSTPDDMAVHFCDARAAVEFGDAIQRICLLGPKHIARWAG